MKDIQKSSKIAFESSQQAKSSENEENDFDKAASGLKIVLIFKLISKFVSLFLTFAVVRNVSPSIFALTFYFQTLQSFQTFYVKICLRDAALKRVDMTPYSKDSSKTERLYIASARNLLIHGLHQTFAICLSTLFLAYILYSHLDPYFFTSSIMFSVSSIGIATSEIFLVEPTIDFNYSYSSISEAGGLFTNSVIQYLMISSFKCDPCLSFGFSNLSSSVVQFILSIVLITLRNSSIQDKSPDSQYNLSLKVQKLREVEDLPQLENLSVLPNMLENSKSFSLLGFLEQFIDKIYGLIFFNGCDFLGLFTLIDPIVNIFQRFIFQPIDVIIKILTSQSVTYNLYNSSQSKILQMNDPQNPKAVQTHSLIVSIFLGIINVYTIALFFLTSYGFPCMKTAVQLVFGDRWTSDVIFVHHHL